ncbi:MAG: ATP-binding protein [Caldilineales bacterium]|nr:ATP-binding protein [Caldilineales bacterium]MDW8317210.1 ATP-binding protein [Anaerolineae bacterium]
MERPPTLEFKSDRGPLSDADLVETVVCLAKAEGGKLFIGVEQDGKITGLHPRHQTDPHHLEALISARTVPPLNVQVFFLNLPSGTVAVVEVPRSNQPVATSDGRMLIRYRDSHNLPGCRPLYPYELNSLYADRGQRDYTAQPVWNTSLEDLDPLEFERLRRLVRRYRGDASLLDLDDRQLALALGLAVGVNGQVTPTVAGLLLVGREQVLTAHLPAHEVAFQVLDRQLVANLDPTAQALAAV